MPADTNHGLADRRWLSRRYLTDLATIATIAGEAGCDPATVHRALRRHGIALRGPVHRGHWGTVLTPRMLRAAVKRGQDHVDIAHHVGAQPRTVHDRMLRLGLLAAPGDRELARRYRAGEPLGALAAAAQQSVRTVARRLRGSGVTLRSAGRPPGAAGGRSGPTQQGEGTARPRGRQAAQRPLGARVGAGGVGG